MLAAASGLRLPASFFNRRLTTVAANKCQATTTTTAAPPPPPPRHHPLISATPFSFGKLQAKTWIIKRQEHFLRLPTWTRMPKEWRKLVVGS